MNPPAAPGRGPIVRTVEGDVNPTELGLVLGHEHLIARPPAFVTDVDLRLDDEEATARGLALFKEAGGGAIVEMTTVDYGRDVAALVRLAARSGVRIVTATGFNVARFADLIVDRYDDDRLVDWMVGEVRYGASEYAPPEVLELVANNGGGVQARPRAGVLKGSSGASGPGPGERRVLQAVAEAHRLTGAPISTHTEKAHWGLEQAGSFVDAGVEPASVLIGHLDFRPEVAYLLEVAATGVNLGFDQFYKLKYLSDEARVKLVAALAAEGRIGQIILSGDLARRSYWPSYGGSVDATHRAIAPGGLAHIPTKVRGMLAAEGLGEEAFRTLTETNPQRWLAFEPR